MLRKLIDQIRDQIRMGRMKRQMRRAKLNQIRERHLRKHHKKAESLLG